MGRVRFCALLFLAALAAPAAADDAKPAMKSIFLVARPGMPDPNFGDSVVLVTQSAGSPPVGVIVNKPTEVAISSVFDDIEALAGSGDKVFLGGPVRPQALSFLFRASSPPEDAIEVLDGIYFSTRVDQLRELLGKAKGTVAVRVYAGHSAWAFGQLENEIARGDWGLVRADAKSIFDKRPQDLWPELRRRADSRPTAAPAPADAAFAATE